METIALLKTAFYAAKLPKAINDFLHYTESLNDKVDKLLEKDLNAAIETLKQLRDIDDHSIVKNLVEHSIMCFNAAVSHEKNERLLFARTGLMFCYHILGQEAAVRHQRSLINDIEFEMPLFTFMLSGTGYAGKYAAKKARTRSFNALKAEVLSIDISSAIDWSAMTE